ncbi:metallopeptidase TldD-related protein [Kitasatospora sp. NPDC093550]|uniref:metallopeptidase TldD-related protein n=1 Tax=Kitasatospora sp. NPDC093550 TaxID=3364089 RepID=UPI00380A2BEC
MTDGPTYAELAGTARAVLAERPRGSDIEVCVRSEERAELVAEGAGGPRSSVGSGTGVAVRLAVGSPPRIGFAATSDLSPHGLRRVVETARALAGAAQPGGFLPEPPVAAAPAARVGATADGPAIGPADADRRTLLDGLLDEARATGLTPVTAAVTAAAHHQVVLSSRGIEAHSSLGWSRAHMTAQVAGPTGRPRQLLGVRLGEGRDASGTNGLVPGLAADLLPQRELPLTPLPDGVPLLFEPFAAAKLLRPLVWALDGGAVRAGKSPVRTGTDLLPPWLELVDDGRPDGGPFGADTDDEGLPTRRARLTGAGTVTGTLDRWSPDRPDGGGQARRFGWAEPPRAAASNLRLSATGPVGAAPPGERFVRVLDATGIETSYNRATGDFRAQLQGCLCAADGTPTGYVQAPWSGNLVRILRRISWIGSEYRWFPLESAIGGAAMGIDPE